MTKVDKLLAVLAKATAGKWMLGEHREGVQTQKPAWICDCDVDDNEGKSFENAAAIVAAVNFCRAELPAMVDALAAAQAEVARLREALDECDRARIMIGARLDSMNEAQKESAINEAWHILQRAIIKADTRAALVTP